MIPNEQQEKWHYLAVNKLCKLLRKITSKNHGDFCFLNNFYSFRTEKN